MAKKTGCRAVPRETSSPPPLEPVNQNRNHQPASDEITLRDEILELKRQVMVLKKTNDQYLVKLRKYEDETKRKDKQLEQLLDPRKNAGVTKVLSTKGAAILMNLKDQNNTLIQMILNKDLHIRRLVAELKMSKLYASTRKNESYRAEITRLRNLLIKSQEMLKEHVEVQQRTRSNCVSGNSLPEFSSSSDQSSPRYLDDLRTTVLGLESHIEHSNELLAKKNQEISHLTDELNILRKFFRFKTYKNKAFDCQTTETVGFTCKWADSLTKTTSQHVLDAFEKNREDEALPHSAPAAPTNWLSSDDPSPRFSSQTKELASLTEPAVTIKNKENCEKVNKNPQFLPQKERFAPVLGKSLFHTITTEELLNDEKVLSNSGRKVYAKEMWKIAMNKFRELKELKPKTLNGCEQEKEHEIPTKFLGVETTESITESYPGNPENSLQEGDSSGLFERKINEREELLTPSSDSANGLRDNDSTSELCQNPEKNCSEEAESFASEKSISKEETDNVKEESQQYLESFQSSWNEEVESKGAKSFREIYHQNLDSSFESDCSYSMKPEERQMQVEVQINSFPPQTESDQSENSVSESDQKVEYGKASGENSVIDFEFNDDDDVIVREK